MKPAGVVGAGVMGCGVAQNLAQSGYDVVLIDLSESILSKAREQIGNNLRFQSLFGKNGGGISNTEEILSRIRFSLDYSQLEDADFVIENVTERWEAKKEAYEKLNAVCGDECVIAVNTSCFSITKIAALTRYPTNVIGVHFMNPVAMKTAVEAVKGYHTSERTIEKIRSVLEKMGKECILVNDYPGFVSNRISHLFMNEAAFVVQDQVASPEVVDDIFRKCYGHKMGPLETADLIGLDTVVNSLEVLYESYQDTKFRCCPLLRKMVDAGLLGRKTGRGFYDYSLM